MELTVAKRLLEKVCKTYKGMVDIVVYDALACNSVWINHCITSKITPVVHVKENNISSIKEIKSKINKGKCKEEWQDPKRNCVVKAYEEGFKMDSVTDPLRFVKFRKKTPEGKYSQVLVVTTDFGMPLQTLYKIMQLFIHRRLTSKITKEMSEKELIRLIEKDMYTYNDKLVIDTC